MDGKVHVSAATVPSRGGDVVSIIQESVEEKVVLYKYKARDHPSRRGGVEEGDSVAKRQRGGVGGGKRGVGEERWAYQSTQSRPSRAHSRRLVHSQPMEEVRRHVRPYPAPSKSRELQERHMEPPTPTTFSMIATPTGPHMQPASGRASGDGADGRPNAASRRRRKSPGQPGCVIQRLPLCSDLVHTVNNLHVAHH